MKRESRWWVLTAGLSVIALNILGAPPERPSPKPNVPVVNAGPGGFGAIEDAEFGHTALGWGALYSNISDAARYDTAIGWNALYSNTTGGNNTAIGAGALINNVTGDMNTALGAGALSFNTTGTANTATGEGALCSNLTGRFNVAVGQSAGGHVTDGNFNIHIGAWVMGIEDDSNTIRIGMDFDPYNEPPSGQKQTFIAGIVESPLNEQDMPTVVGIDPYGRLGTMSSDLLPSKGDKGDPGEPGPQGEGLVSGSLLFLATGTTPPAGYALLGSTEFNLAVSGRRVIRYKVDVYERQ